MRAIDSELSLLKLKYGEHVLADTNTYELHITAEGDLAGLPDGVKEAAAGLAKSKEKSGWIFTLDYPSYVPFVTYADNRELRQTISIAAGKKGFQQNENNNEEIVLKISKLRYQRAQLLGYETHAHFVLEERMAQNPAKVSEFLSDLLIKAKPAAKEEFHELTAFAKETDGIDKTAKMGRSLLC